MHELRTPLNAILAWAQVLGPDAGRAELEHGLQSIARSARRQARLLEQLSRAPEDREADDADDDDDVVEEPLPDLGGCRVLVVDDDEAARVATAGIVMSARAVGWQASSAVEAIDCLRRRAFDVIVSDITMPGMDGHAFMAAVRADRSRRVRVTPAIALSALTSPTARRRTYRAGFQIHLTKPVDAVELCLAIANLVTLARAGSTDRTPAGS